MIKYFWKQRAFWDDVEQEIKINKPKKIIISSAYLSLKGVDYLKRLFEMSNLKKEDITVYCSTDLHDSKPADILQELNSFSSIRLVVQPFLHSKIYEFHLNDKVILYNGSANLTDGGISRNLECMSKSVVENSPVSDFWEHLSDISVEVTKEVIALYQTYQRTFPPRVIKKDEALQSYLEKIKQNQQKKKSYPDLTAFYFDVEDYITVSKEWYKVASSEAKKRRKGIQDKLLALHKEIEPKVKNWDLHPHYHSDYITSGINPSDFNHGRVGAIWVRYGKHKDELNPYGGVVKKNRRGNKDPIEQFHKHACLQVSFSTIGIDLGLFHSTAHNGIDRYHVREHWNEIKKGIDLNYQSLIGNSFVWHFYDAKTDKSKYHFEIDKGTVEEFLKFYLKYDEDGLESFCMRHYPLNDERIRTKNNIVEEALKTFKALMPIYQVMTFRIPVSMR
ncbi:phospholipase D family protein [Peribacillus butanolivorans]|uniref:phospholipase D family protein n=1 Tax=Peribacillus butanolivorans TaxID=421767 RepID=UPI00367177B1